MDLAYLPSPSNGVLHLGPVPLRAYAFCIILGVFVAVWLGNRRWVARGGEQGVIADVTLWAVPFGLAGGRLYHVITSPDAYFGERGEPIRALYVWEGGLGIWGAIALGAVGAWIGCRRHRIRFPDYADAVAPGIALAQAIGRWGNWFNQELYGRPTTLPWGLDIDRAHRPSGMLDIATYHPTFLYESLWDIGVAALVLWAASRFALGHGRTFALYVAAYTVGRFWTEYLRIDESHTFLGLRLNGWTSVVVLLGAIACLVISTRRHSGSEPVSRPKNKGDNERAAEPRLDVAVRQEVARHLVPEPTSRPPGSPDLNALGVTTEPPRAATPLRAPGISSWPKRIAWGALTLFLAAFAVFESQKYGLPTTAAALMFFGVPDLTRLVGIRPPSMLHQAVNRGWIPLVVLVGYSVGPIVWPPLFTAGLGWLTRIAFDRTRGRGLASA